MENFFVIEIADGDEKIKGKGIYAYEEEKQAIASFHSKLGTAMKSELYISDLVMVIDASGKVLKREKYNA